MSFGHEFYEIRGNQNIFYQYEVNCSPHPLWSLGAQGSVFRGGLWRVTTYSGQGALQGLSLGLAGV